MWESPDEARTDFFLAGAVYVIGPAILSLLLGLLPTGAVLFVDRWLSPVFAFATTGLVPLLLARYRKQGLRHFGFGRGVGGVVQGLLLSLPLVVASVLAVLAQPQPDLGNVVPATALLGRQGLDALLSTVTQVVFWGGFAWLMVFATSKARAAFRPLSGNLRSVALQVGRIVAAVAAVAFIALLLSRGGPLANAGLDGRSTLASILGLALPALGVAGAVLLALRSARGPLSTDRWTIAAPVVLAALGPFRFTLQGDVLVFLLYVAALFGGVALTAAVVIESRRPAEIVITLGVAIALLTAVGGFGTS